MKRQHGIMCYGTPEDREKLQAVARVMGVTGSTWILQQIRKRHAELFGEAKS